MTADGSRARNPRPRARDVLRGAAVETIREQLEVAERSAAALRVVLADVAAVGIDVEVGYGPKIVQRVSLAAGRLDDVATYCRRQLQRVDAASGSA